MIKKFIPSVIKSKFRNAVLSILNRDNRIPEMEKRINRLSILVNSLYPEKIIFSEGMDRIFEKFCHEKGIASLNKSIAKNDLMFHFVLHVYSNINRTLYYYLDKGFRQTQICLSLIKSYLQQEPDSLFDFACGHGNQTRFFVTKFPPEAITVSDIKESAVEFQKKEFGVNGIVSSFVPEDFHITRKFDFILVSSLFSHLNEDLFVRWLKVLYNLVSDKGILLISTHGQHPENQSQEFLYKKSSEDSMFFEFEDSITNTDNYGSTFISENYFFKLLKDASIPQSYCVRYAQLWEGQDLYVLAKKNIERVEL